MKISKDLIEKYHRNECSPEESDAVEAWLFSSDSDEALQLPMEESKPAHKAAIWEEISSILPNEEEVRSDAETGRKSLLKNSFWSGAIAASLVIILIAVASNQLLSKKEPINQLVSINNTSSVNVRHVEDSGYRLSVGTNTSARIDNLTGVVDLSGSMLICPKKDITLSFEGSAEKITFKQGQTYIILKGKDGKDQIIIISEKNLMDLPPMLQKQIINEFNI
ncbi:hypothetical protein [Pedobacter sp. GR22-6]|uniref:hypothetical protein n=1 Tax=Pedobacter sp. GR22-6 TaxID=3127957 RepID=UPI00307CE6C8